MSDDTLTKITDALEALPSLDATGKRLVTAALVAHLPGLVAEVRRLREGIRLRVVAGVRAALACVPGTAACEDAVVAAVLKEAL